MSVSLRTAFHLFDKGIVSFVGAGGKTTLMFRMAKELAAAGSSVLTTTTTKIYYPTPDQSPHVLIDADPVQLVRKAEAFNSDIFHVTAAAGYDEASGKLLGYVPDAIDLLWKTDRFQWILVEADGAAGKPLKAPASHEPVIPEDTTVLVAVVGLDAIGKPLTEDWVFRSRLYSRITDCPLGEAITTESVYHALTLPKGIIKGCPKTAEKFVFLNTTKTPFPRKIGQKLCVMLARGGRVYFRDVLTGSTGDDRTEIVSLISSENESVEGLGGAAE